MGAVQAEGRIARPFSTDFDQLTLAIVPLAHACVACAQWHPCHDEEVEPQTDERF